jgi:predicted transposase/invertase (TIGR01784 family)
MKNKKHNYHDSGYKKLFSNTEMVRQLLTSFVKEDWVTRIDYSRLQRVDKSFITDEFAGRESDIIYKAFFKEKEIYIFILLEFQSTVDRFMSLRMLRYISELYEYLIKNYKIKTLPSVFPVMLYNGEKRWTAPEELCKLIETSIPERYIPQFRYYRIAENEFSKEFLKDLNNTAAALFYTENCSEEELRRDIDTIAAMLKKERPDEITLFVNWFKYMFQGRDDIVEEIRGIEEAKTMLRSSINRMSKRLIAEGKREGLQRGIQEGIEKGLQRGLQRGIYEGKLDTAKALLGKNMPVKEISEITGLSVKDIEKLQ